MTAEFVFFMGIASICFSGLLFTLWTLASEKWTIRAIGWLMIQIWFGNTTLSFGRAASFHPCKFYYRSILSFLNPIRSFRAYIDGWVCRLKQHPPPYE